MFVPSLKGLGISGSAYPALKRWAIFFRPAKRDSFRAPSTPDSIDPSSWVFLHTVAGRNARCIKFPPTRLWGPLRLPAYSGQGSDPRLCVCPRSPQNSTPSNERLACRDDLDLERNTADAIVLRWLRRPNRRPPRRTGQKDVQPHLLKPALNRRNQAEPGTQIPAKAITSDASVFGGGELPSNSLGRPKTTTWKGTVLPTSCGCQEGNATYGILLLRDNNQKGYRAVLGFSSVPPSSNPNGGIRRPLRPTPPSLSPHSGL